MRYCRKYNNSNFATAIAKFKNRFRLKNLKRFFYVIDDKLKTENDNPSIGILLSKEKNKVKAEYALKDINKPIGISEYELIKSIPEDLKSNLTTIEELEREIEDKMADK